MWPMRKLETEHVAPLTPAGLEFSRVGGDIDMGLQRGRLVVVSNSLYFRIGLAAGSADRRKRYRHGRQSSRSSHSCEIDQRCVSTRAAIAGVTLPRPFPESLVRTAEGVVSEVE